MFRISVDFAYKKEPPIVSDAFSSLDIRMNFSNNLKAMTFLFRKILIFAESKIAPVKTLLHTNIYQQIIINKCDLGKKPKVNVLKIMFRTHT